MLLLINLGLTVLHTANAYTEEVNMILCFEGCLSTSSTFKF